MGYISAASETFLSMVKSWIEEKGEVLVMIRYSACAGNKSFEFISDYDAFKKIVNRQGSRTCLIVFRQQQLPLRGIVDEEFIKKAKDLVGDGEEYLLTGLDLTVIGKGSWYHYNAGDTHQEMEEDIRSCFGKRIAFGKYPPWLYDSEDVISAVIPEPDGTVICGIY